MNRILTIFRTFILILLAASFPTELAAQIQFINVTESAGVSGDLNSPLSTSLSWGDIDNDGYLDLYVTNWGTSVSEARDFLYRNNGDGTFTDITDDAWVTSYYNSIAAVFGDYDNDGYIDLYVVNYDDQDILFKNYGDGTFGDETGYAGMDVSSLGFSYHAAWGDYDLDGDLDLYLCKFGVANELYANNGDGSFTELGSTAGVADVRDSRKAVWIDYDNDGDIDLYVVNHEQDNAMYRNNGNGTFTDISGQVLLNDTEIGRSAAWGDYNNDGLVDLFLANIGANKLYENKGDNLFEEKGKDLGVRASGNGWENWDAIWGDYDGDGDLDLFVVGGAESDDASNVFFLNIGNSFVDITSNSGDLRPGPLRATACSFADYDNDGDLDIFMTSYRDARNIVRNALYQNRADSNSFLKVRVQGKGSGKSNVSGIGAKVRIYDVSSGVLKAHREIQSGTCPLEALFGLVSGQSYRLEVTFPGSQQTKISQNVTVPATLTVSEP